LRKVGKSEAGESMTFFERPKIASLLGMIGYLLSMMFILTVIMSGAPAPLQ
jgi:hypothetical protein